MRSLQTTRNQALAVLLAGALAVAACSTNPATGKRQIALVSQEQEISMGRQADQQIVSQLGLYNDKQMQDYVNRLGQELARSSERPDLPWTFRVVDDPVVNAFALPGGYIYVTRGLLAHLTTEAELVSVLGHEIGHVTGRHSVEQMSKAQLAQIGLIAGMVLRPELAQYGDLAQTGLGLLFLKYGRDDEREADDLGLRYMIGDGYDPREMPGVFETLARVSQQQGQGRIPGWLSTHPAPENRSARISEQIAKLGAAPAGNKVNRERYLTAIDGVVFGQDPREGYFRGSLFIHPELGFQIRFPEGWRTSNQKAQVGAMSPQEDAVVVLTLARQDSPRAAAQAFFSQQGVQQGQAVQANLGGSSLASIFGVARQGGANLQGLAAFAEQGGKVYQILGYTLANNWSRYDNVFGSSVGSFERVTDRRALDVSPKRIDVVSLPSAMTIEEFARRYPSTVDIQTLAIINGVKNGERIAAGTEVKRVVGGELPS